MIFSVLFYVMINMDRNKANTNLSLLHYIYIIREREFLKTKENIFKIGWTWQQQNDRLSWYPKEVILFVKVNDSKIIENNLLKVLK